jgi:membrane protein
MKTIRQWIGRFLQNPTIHFVVDLFKRFGNNNGAFYAAGLSFFLMLSFVPMILSGVAVLGSIFNVHTASLKVSEAIENMLPAGGARDEAVKFLTSRLHLDDQVTMVVKERGVAGIFGFLSLVWSAIQIFLNASTAMNVMWQVKETRNWFLLRGMALLMMVFTGLMSVFSLLLSSAPAAIVAFHLPVDSHFPIRLGVLSFVFEIIALLVNGLMYLIMYKVLPNANVGWIAAAIGGISASIFFEIAKKLLGSYLLRPNHTVYGDLAGLILFILWIYYSMTILLFGAEISAAVARQLEGKRKTSHRGTSRPERLPVRPRSRV